MYTCKRKRERIVGEGDRKRKVRVEGERKRERLQDTRPHPENTITLLKVIQSKVKKEKNIAY